MILSVLVLHKWQMMQDSVRNHTVRDTKNILLKIVRLVIEGSSTLYFSRSFFLERVQQRRSARLSCETFAMNCLHRKC